MTDPANDHVGLTDTFASRRYFRKFEGITVHLLRVAANMEADGAVSKEEVKIISRYLSGLLYTFRALSMKYLLVGRDTGRFFGSLNMDKRDSGFPVAAELLTMANDAQQAQRHLANMPSEAELKDDMVRTIIGQQQVPTKLQFALSQRQYYEELLKGELFWARNDPECLWIGNDGDRRRFMLHWAVYDSQINLPVIYLMELEDSGKTTLPKDQRRWPEVQAHLMAQSMAGLKLLTIAKGFDQDFDDLHPKSLKRIHVGPMYSSAYTEQSGPLRRVLAEAEAPEGQDWALAWTTEELASEQVIEERAGWFSTVEREVFALDPFGGQGAETGTTRMQRSIILPQRPFQVLAEQNPPGFGDVRKFVVSATGQVLRY
ncbi:hypothetical protein DS909_11835 [Phaeobacter gallaeciensis]|uniref:Uncharacterized protein n=2 Tax=Roseobacteraceae TaxID=2854170 RepID=A0A366WWS6_9RHOB|nr:MULTISPECIES: hypothetical protein [Roseobacteraceae]MBT3141156.1 hypothetical protein [Falsiruegeria litorea]MBT8170845.1 hypothetical protein [Falsiruegeria litorea]RBW54518.1 hypothetical protein DS909_11835 [Phaeobacter gallaeciensis]